MKSRRGTAPPVVEEAVKLPEKISFNGHIQPILSEYCYHCHGPDAKTRQPKNNPLRLDRKEDAFALRSDGRPVIIKGNPAESMLYQLIMSPDPDLVMPPPKSHKTMKRAEKEMLRLWIEQGAEYESHWSFTPVRKPEVPKAGAGWVANPVDAFIAEKLEANHLKPNPPEDLRRFFRRMHLDLTGLPPSPDRVDAFVRDAGSDPQAAIVRAADELLASMECAEHFARYWLDTARYADTHGIHIDNYRSIWPYRDWVIRAFHNNMPWDQFTTEQIAGDLLPGRTLDQWVATGFCRCNATTGEGGAIGEEYEAIYAKDRVDTVSAAWLGLTTGCASCHDHKFDPVSSKDFYSMAAFFRNTPMAPLDGNKADHPPNVFVPQKEDRARWVALDGEISAAEKGLLERSTAAVPEFEAWLASRLAAPAPVADPSMAIQLPLNTPEGPLRGMVDGQPREWNVVMPAVDGPLGKAPVISGNPVELGDFGGFSRGDKVTYGGFIRVEGTPTGAVVARMNPSEAFRGWDLYLQNGRPAAHVIDSWPGAANKILAAQPLKPGEWHHVMVTFDGSQSGPNAMAMYLDGVRTDVSAEAKTVGGNVSTSVPMTLGSRYHGDSKLGAAVALQDFRFYRKLLTPEEISAVSFDVLTARLAALPPDKRTKEWKDPVFRKYLLRYDAPSAVLRQRISSLKSEQSAIRSRGAVSLVMEEKPTPAHAYILSRGVYTAKGEKVTANTPEALPPMAADAPKNRLGLARWLNDPSNPLPARVTMNRAWAMCFGNGIVETAEDFGIMGARPSHPALLDWLAAEFVESKWNFRHMVRLMVTSAAYRQSAVVTPETYEKDPSNRLVARGPRIRLDAEPIRDLALSASGLLSAKVGGPPVKPYQPEGIWEAVAMKESNTRNYQQDSGDSLYRRSVYTMWKRTAAPPSMEILNAPTRETFCVRRERTNTPLQALVVLNDPQFVEASRELAVGALKHSADYSARLDYITLRLDGRRFDAGEKEIAKKSFDSSLAAFRSDRESALKLISTGAKAPPKDMDPAELAAWTLVASQILNLDETLTR